MDDDQLPLIDTRVAHFGYGDTRFCGYGVRTDLVGRSGFWNSISLAVSGPRLSREQEEILDGLATASINADPRIWPLKVARLLSSHGSALSGLVGSIAALDGGYVGAPAIEGSSRLLVECREIMAEGGRNALEAHISRCVGEGRRLMGFGVPNRERDERVLGTLVLVEKHGLASGAYWQLMLTIESIAVTKKPTLKTNIGAVSSALFLDMGFAPAQIGMLATLMLLNNMLANAHEGAQQVHPILQEFPVHLMEYHGPAPRKSPRATVVASAAINADSE